MEQVPCPDCEQQVGVTKAGLLYKHASGDSPCPGSGKAVSQDDGADWLDDEPQPEADEPGPELKPVADNIPTGDRREVYTWLVRVSLPAMWLDDAAWHQQNELMAVKQAEGAGCTVTGEARWDDQPDYRTDGSLVLTYLVPIKG